MDLESLLSRTWYPDQGPHRAALRVLSWALLPLAGAYCAVAALRRLAYRRGWRRAVRLPVPVVVVGNLTVGGTGKTPLVLWLVQRLRRAGYRPGVVSRGYGVGGDRQRGPRLVGPEADPARVGDEPVLLARRASCPVAVCPDRAAAGRLLVETAGCDCLVADDGLQHYRLARDLEVVVMDGGRRLGNGLCLPAGPLREPASRLASVDLRVANGQARAGEHAMALVPGQAVRLLDGRALPLGELAEMGGEGVHGVAGIGNPARFFATLRDAGLAPVTHAFPDHHAFTREDLDFGDGLPVLMTEKDAVKCQAFADGRLWYVPVDAVLPEAFAAAVLARLAGFSSPADCA
jgi:tetraacyldisaccharide 4'-kinase